MSSNAFEGVATDRDSEVMALLSEQSEANDDRPETVAELADTVTELVDTVDYLQTKLADERARNDQLEETVKQQGERIDELTESGIEFRAESVDFDDALDRMGFYADLPDRVLTDGPFDVSQVRHAAIEIWRNWDEWKHDLGEERTGINTVRRKGESSRSPMKLKADLEAKLPYDLDNRTVYRAMKCLARELGSEKVMNEKRNKPEYRGGLMEYHIRPDGNKALVWTGRYDN